MKKIKLLLLLLLIIPFTGKSQDFDYEVSRPYQVVDARNKFYLYQDDEIISIKAHGKKYIVIQKWDANSMKEISRNKYEDAPAGFQLESFQKFKDNYYMFYSVWDKPNKKEQLFVRRIDFESGKFIDNGQLVLKVDGKVTSSLEGGGMFGNNGSWGIRIAVMDKFNIQSSYDESTVLVQYRRKPEKRDDDVSKDIIGFGIFDSEMEKISLEEIEMPYTESKMNNLDYSIDSEGRVYVLAMVYNDDTQRLTKNDEVNYGIELLRIDALSDELTNTPIKLGSDIYLSEIILFNQKNDEMVCAGYYTNDRKTIGDANGVIMFGIDKDAELTDMRKYEIPLEVLNMYKKERAQKKNEKKEKKGKAEFENLSMRELIAYEDGSSLLIGEQHYVVRHTTYSSNGSSRTYYTYHYNDLLVTKLDKSGELVWMKKLGKRQTGKGQSPFPIQGGMSYKYFSNQDSHYFLFLDNIKNKDLGLNERPAGHSDGAGGFFTAYKLDDETGSISKVSLFDTRDVHGIDVFQFQINRIVQTSDTEFIVEVYKKKKEDILIKVRVRI